MTEPAARITFGPADLTPAGVGWLEGLAEAGARAEAARLEAVVVEATAAGMGVLVRLREFDRVVAPSALVPAGTIVTVDESAIGDPWGWLRPFAAMVDGMRVRP